MTRKFFALVALIGHLSTVAAAPVLMTPVTITEGVYLFQHSQGSGNSTVVITDDGVLVFDFHIDNADQTLAGIRKLTEKKVAAIAPSRFLCHVFDSSVADRSYQSDVQPDIRGNRLRAKGHPGVRRGQCAGRWFHSLRRSAHRPTDRRARPARTGIGQITRNSLD